MDNNMTFLNACRNGQKSIVQIFLQKGGINVNKRDAEGNTPLHYACLKGFRDIVNMLLEHDADVSVANNCAETPLYNPQIQISVVSGTKRSIFRQKNKTKRSKKRLHTTLIKPEQKVNEDLCSGFIVS